VVGGKHIWKKQLWQVFGSAKVRGSGPIVIPKEARELFNIQRGDTLLILGEENRIDISLPKLLRDLADEIFDDKRG